MNLETPSSLESSKTVAKIELGKAERIIILKNTLEHMKLSETASCPAAGARCPAGPSRRLIGGERGDD